MRNSWEINVRWGQTTAAIFGTLLIALSAVAHTPQATTTAPKIQTKTYDFKEASRQQEYALYVPSAYDKSKPTPLIVALHGLGGTPRQILGTRGFTDLAEKRGYIVVAPYGYNERGGYGGRGGGRGLAGRGGGRLGGGGNDPPNLGDLSEKDVLNVLEVVRQDYNIDADRTYLMGHSMGGGGTLYFGLKYAENWAALAPFAPAVNASPSSPDALAKAKHLPIIVVQGDNDTLVPVEATRRWVEKMKELGMTHEYVEVAGGDHIRIVAPNLERMFDFFDKHKRTSK